MSHINNIFAVGHRSAAALFVGVLFASGSAVGQTIRYAPDFSLRSSIFEQVLSDRESEEARRTAPGGRTHLRRRVVAYHTREAPGTVVIDTPNTVLYYFLGGGKAISYGIGVGREGFTWSGVQAIARKAQWPDWIPPAEMLERQPYLPRFMAGGPGNPLGAAPSISATPCIASTAPMRLKLSANTYQADVSAC